MAFCGLTQAKLDEKGWINSVQKCTAKCAGGVDCTKYYSEHPASTCFLSAVKENLAILGCSDVLDTSEALIYLIKELILLKRKSCYTPQSESRVGRRVMKAWNSGGDDQVSVWTDLPVEYQQVVVDVTSDLLRPTDHTPNEDRFVNGPLHRLLRANHVSHNFQLTVSHSNLCDMSGREQRPDMTVFDSLLMGWPSVLTMLHGQLAWNNVLLGQCMRRAEAILEMQPYRDFVVVPMYCGNDLRLLKLERSTWSIYLTHTVPLFVKDANEKPCQANSGIKLLVYFLNHPELLGYTPCPVKLHSLEGYIPLTSWPVCARSEGRAVFTTSAPGESVVKAYANEDLASSEFICLQQLQGLSGIPTLIDNRILQCEVSTWLHPNPAPWYALTLGPYCDSFTAFKAKPHHFAQFACTLNAAYEEGWCHNDISFDNLMVRYDTTEGGGKDECYVMDWGIAMKPGEVLDKKSGKIMFVPPRYIDERTGEALKERLSSLLYDLETLFIVTMCCWLEEIPWEHSPMKHQYAIRRSSCGLGSRGFSRSKAPAGEWSFLNDIAEELRSEVPRAKEVLRIFECQAKL